MSEDFEPRRPETPPPAERQEEFIGLLQRHHGLLLRYVTSLVGNRHDAEDVLQRASIVMWRRYADFAAGTDFIAWATTFAFYEARNFQRTTARSRLTFDDQLLEILAAERVLEARRSVLHIAALEACVERLDESGKTLVRAVYEEGRTVAEYAQQQGLAVQTIYNKLTQIRRALAQCVERRLAEGGA